MTDARRFLSVALTGGIATGKSHCLAQFVRLGVETIDADQVAHEAIAPGTPGFSATVARFGPSILGPDGRVDRVVLAPIVFADPDARRDLEGIVHPAVYIAIRAWFTSQVERADAEDRGFAVADIPLLYETGRERDFDRVVVAACRPEQQLARLMARNHLAEADARQRIDSQIAIADKARRADCLIDTSGTMIETNEQVVKVWERLRTEARHQTR